ncbi:MAG: hypothetical protein AB7H90_08915 [Alphaproteobacteria bacterium]
MKRSLMFSQVAIAVAVLSAIASPAPAGQRIDYLVDYICGISGINRDHSNYLQCQFQARGVVVTFASKCSALGITEADPKFIDCVWGGIQTTVQQVRAKEHEELQARQKEAARQAAIQEALAEAERQRRLSCLAAALGTGSGPSRVPQSFGSILGNAAAACQ